MHRLLETWAKGDRLPEAPAVAAALRQGGLPLDAAASLAPELLAELAACRADPALQRLLSPALEGAASEWPLEDCPAPGVLRRGRLDRLAFDGEHWWILDYKTSRPLEGEAWEVFIAQEAARYRPQLLAYRDMVAGLKGLDPGQVRPALYFTACRRLVEVK